MTQPSLLIFYGQRMTGFTAALRSVTSVALYLRVPEKQSNACFLGKRSYKALWHASISFALLVAILPFNDAVRDQRPLWTLVVL